MSCLRNIALESVTEKCDRRADRRTEGQTDDGQSDPYVSQCFAGETKRYIHINISINEKTILSSFY